jgi:Phytanoyl-CoA dioxygenase (PhyH)
MEPIRQPLQQDLFTSATVNAQLAREGYAILDICLPEQLNPVIQGTSELLANFRRPDGQFFNFGQLHDIDMRNRSYELIQKEILPIAGKYLSGNAEIYAGTHLIKPPGEKSGFDPHQDNTMVDETRSRSYIIWIPLVEVHSENGAVCILPKSHRLGNIYRAVSIPWIFREVQAEMAKHMMPVFLKAGQALVFDSALIHLSLPNRSDKTRIAVNSMVISKKSAIIKCIYRKHWLKKYIDIYEVGMDYYLNQANEEKPMSGYTRIDTVDYPEKVIGKAAFGRLLDVLDQDQ